MYLEIYLTDTLYIIDREKVDEVSREWFSRIGNGKSTRYQAGKENKNISRRLRVDFFDVINILYSLLKKSKKVAIKKYFSPFFSYL